MNKLSKEHYDELHMFHTLMQHAYLHQDMNKFKVLIDTFSDYLNTHKEQEVKKSKENQKVEPLKEKDTTHLLDCNIKSW